MKTIKITSAVLLALAILLSLGVLSAFADAPAGVAYLDNQSHSIAPGASQLYQFDYSVDTVNNIRPVTSITLVNGNNSGLGFQVWTPDNVTDMVDNKPVGVGSPYNVDCTTGNILGNGGCQSNDLIWKGAFGTSGSYFVLVTNSANSQMNFQLNIQGSGVSLGQQTASAPSAPAAAPAVNANLDDPGKATALDNAQHSIPAGSATWYSFNYQMNQDGSRPEVTIILPGGTNSGVSFQVWSPDRMGDSWWNNTPVGQGTAALVDCTTGEVSAMGGCASPDLSWMGNFAGSGTYFVRVINSNAAPANVVLNTTIQ